MGHMSHGQATYEDLLVYSSFQHGDILWAFAFGVRGLFLVEEKLSTSSHRIQTS